jgi:hypothetical protein
MDISCNYAMKINFTVFLWFLKIGAVINLYFLQQTLSSHFTSVHPQVLLAARILFAVSAYRCLFPVRYKDNVVFHDSPFSSIFITRGLATLSEIALIYQLAYVLRTLNSNQQTWLEILSWVMVFQVVISQVFVWGAILTGELKLFFYEELGWAFIYLLNTAGSVYLSLTLDHLGGAKLLLQINLLFGTIYLPWQILHLRTLLLNARRQIPISGQTTKITSQTLRNGLVQSIRQKNQTFTSEAWGGWIGATWMSAYWASLIPIWVYLIIRNI